ncbi:MAG: PilZ domain, partial [Nitrospirae bacterium]|nr:PilZ domain [Nitrospirota bacterium]
MIEKRKADRVYTHEVMEYRLGDKEQKKSSAVCVMHDLSRSGACLYLQDEVSVGDKITLMYKLASFQKNAVVQWVKKMQDDFYMVGMMFHD